MRVLFDVNVLIALLDPGHVHHDRAHVWWEQTRASGWASCPPHPERLCPRDVAIGLSQFCHHAGGDPHPRPWQTHQQEHAFWSDNSSITDSDRFRSERILGPKQVTDLYLLSLAVQRDGRLATFDRTIPLSAVVGAKSKHLAVL